MMILRLASNEIENDITSDSTKCNLEYHIDFIHEMKDLIRGNGI